jgi:hypothetical protein
MKPIYPDNSLDIKPSYWRIHSKFLLIINMILLLACILALWQAIQYPDCTTEKQPGYCVPQQGNAAGRALPYVLMVLP